MQLNQAVILGAQFKRSQETVKTTHTPFHDGVNRFHSEIWYSLTVNTADNDLSPVRRQAIIWTKNEILSIEAWKLQWNFNRGLNIFINENAYVNVVCEIATILSRPKCFKC